MRRFRFPALAVALTVGLVACPSSVQADGGDGAQPVQSSPSPAGAHASSGSPETAAPLRAGAREPAVSLIARLRGDRTAPGRGGDAAGDRDGRAVALVKIQGDRITFALEWSGIATPTLGHLHQGGPDDSGEVVAGLFASAMPEGAHAASGQTVITDPDLAERLRTAPGGFYVSLHTAEFPDGAVRAQLEPLARRANPLSIVRGGALRAQADGGQEAASASDRRAVADPDGHAVTFLHPSRDSLGYSLAWINIDPPTAAHIHHGAPGLSGPVAVPLFNTPVPRNVFALSGRVPVADATALRRIASDPSAFYSRLHTREFPSGAVRGQLFRGSTTPR